MLDRNSLPHDTIKGSQVLEPLFEFSGACAGCGRNAVTSSSVSQALRDRDDRGQRHGLHLNLRRQPATTPWTSRQGPRTGLEQLPLRGQRRFGLGMRLGLDAQTEHRPAVAREAGTGRRRGNRPRLLDARSGEPSRRSRRSVSASSVWAQGSGRPSTARTSSTPRVCWLSPETSSGRAFGSFGGAAGPTTSASAVSNQVLSSGRNINVLVLAPEVYSNTAPSLQGHPARRRREVRSGPRAPARRTLRDRPVVRQRLRSPDFNGRQHVQTTQGATRGGRLAGAVPGHRYANLYRPRIDMEKSMAHQKTRSRAATGRSTYQPSEVENGKAVQARLRAPSMPLSEFRRRRNTFRRSQSAPTRHGQPSLRSSPRPTQNERYRFYEQTGRHRADRPASTTTQPRLKRARKHDRRSTHQVPRTGAAVAIVSFGLAADRRPGRR